MLMQEKIKEDGTANINLTLVEFETPEICISLVTHFSPITINMYTYLDISGHVNVTVYLIISLSMSPAGKLLPFA